MKDTIQKIYTDEFGDSYAIIPDEVMKELGWSVLDEVRIEVIEVLEDKGEHKGLVISNLTKNKKIIK